MSRQKEVDELLRELSHQGFQVEKRLAHPRVLCPDGTRLSFPRTPSDGRFRANNLPELRRHGFIWPPPLARQAKRDGRRPLAQSLGHRVLFALDGTQGKTLTSLYEELSLKEEWEKRLVKDLLNHLRLKGHVQSIGGNGKMVYSLPTVKEPMATEEEVRRPPTTPLLPNQQSEETPSIVPSLALVRPQWLDVRPPEMRILESQRSAHLSRARDSSFLPEQRIAMAVGPKEVLTLQEIAERVSWPMEKLGALEKLLAHLIKRQQIQLLGSPAGHRYARGSTKTVLPPSGPPARAKPPEETVVPASIAPFTPSQSPQPRAPFSSAQFPLAPPPEFFRQEKLRLFVRRKLLVKELEYLNREDVAVEAALRSYDEVRQKQHETPLEAGGPAEESL